MLEKPDLSDELIINHLQFHYRLSIVALEFLPIGNDATAWVYKVSAADQTTYFLKVKYREIAPAAVSVPYVLHQSGISQ